MKEELIKKKLLAEFREWFCEGYCQFYGMDDYCRCCPVKDESCWLREVEKPAGKGGNGNPSVSVIHAGTLNRMKEN